MGLRSSKVQLVEDMVAILPPVTGEDLTDSAAQEQPVGGRVGAVGVERHESVPLIGLGQCLVCRNNIKVVGDTGKGTKIVVAEGHPVPCGRDTRVGKEVPIPQCDSNQMPGVVGNQVGIHRDGKKRVSGQSQFCQTNLRNIIYQL